MGHGASIDISNISPEEAKKLMIELDTGKGNDEDRSGGHGTETSTRSKRVRQQKNIFSEVRALGSLILLLAYRLYDYLFTHIIT